ncbi:tetratricopeptide repeat protein [Roseateles cellulosilyticus]|uniref:Tetratricopeptide repeat protein n=1 Tax=Pelomonas cellulosilytica TaxID=2906762 RepID=A0ABS8XJ87_9BURK|nr:tetratricopeptide repeat protein [Pelomonas sp. P8]MCE4552926.1 hypothetical protein [Pelomonas sp. P8]
MARAWCRLGAVAALAGALGAAHAADAPAPRLVKDPHYGDTLFHLYQDQYFTAITGLMASQHFERVSRHADEAELLRGGLLLSYGLHREAGEVFTRLLAQTAAPPVRDRAWFYLAKIRYQRGLLAEALDALGRIGTRLPPDLDEERVLLYANALLANQDAAGAARLLNGATQRPGAGLYARYNLGVALVRGGDVASGRRWLDELGRAQSPPMPATEEYRSLRDQANLALGFALLRDDKPADAAAMLQRVRLDGLQSDKALLGYGWALAAANRHDEALVPWNELLRRGTRDAAALEAHMAVPYSYAQLGAFGQALARYNDAIAFYGQEDAALNESISAIRAGKLLDGLLAANPGVEMGWFAGIRQLPDMPHAGHLTDVLAQHEFQEAFKNLRDLQFLAGNLQDWQDKLAVFDDMLANRRQAYAERLPAARAQAGAAGLDALQKRRDDIAAELQRVDQQLDTQALATARQYALIERVKRVNESLAAMTPDASLDVARERARLAAGLLTWDLAQDHVARLWTAQKDLRTIDRELAGARAHDAALARAQTEEPARFEAFARRVADVRGRIAALIPRVADLSRQQQQAAQEIAVAELARQKERLALYNTQARFAVAQLHDRASVSKEGDRAPKP